MYKHVLLSFFAASTAPSHALADSDVVHINVPSWSATFNAYVIECDLPINPERHHQFTAYNLAVNMDGTSQLEQYLSEHTDLDVWQEYNPAETGFKGAFIVSAEGERFFVRDNLVAGELLDRLHRGDLDARGIPVEEAQKLVPAIIAQCGFGT